MVALPSIEVGILRRWLLILYGGGGGSCETLRWVCMAWWVRGTHTFSYSLAARVWAPNARI